MLSLKYNTDLSWNYISEVPLSWFIQKYEDKFVTPPLQVSKTVVFAIWSSLSLASLGHHRHYSHHRHYRHHRHFKHLRLSRHLRHLGHPLHLRHLRYIKVCCKKTLQVHLLFMIWYILYTYIYVKEQIVFRERGGQTFDI